MAEMARDLLARHSLGERGFAEYKADQVKRGRLIELVANLERRAKKISQKVMQIQVYIVGLFLLPLNALIKVKSPSSQSRGDFLVYCRT